MIDKNKSKAWEWRREKEWSGRKEWMEKKGLEQGEVEFCN